MSILGQGGVESNHRVLSAEKKIIKIKRVKIKDSQGAGFFNKRSADSSDWGREREGGGKTVT